MKKSPIRLYIPAKSAVPSTRFLATAIATTLDYLLGPIPYARLTGHNLSATHVSLVHILPMRTVQYPFGSLMVCTHLTSPREVW
jgi:hypothetical protein